MLTKCAEKKVDILSRESYVFSHLDSLSKLECFNSQIGFDSALFIKNVCMAYRQSYDSSNQILCSEHLWHTGNCLDNVFLVLSDKEHKYKMLTYRDEACISNLNNNGQREKDYNPVFENEINKAIAFFNIKDVKEFTSTICDSVLGMKKIDSIGNPSYFIGFKSIEDSIAIWSNISQKIKTGRFAFYKTVRLSNGIWEIEFLDNKRISAKLLNRKNMYNYCL